MAACSSAASHVCLEAFHKISQEKPASEKTPYLATRLEDSFKRLDDPSGAACPVFCSAVCKAWGAKQGEEEPTVVGVLWCGRHAVMWEQREKNASSSGAVFK